MAKIKSESGKREKRMTITVSVPVYNGVKALAALDEKTINDYVFQILEEKVNQNLPAIQRVFEAQKIYQQTLFNTAMKEKFDVEGADFPASPALVQTEKAAE